MTTTPHPTHPMTPEVHPMTAEYDNVTTTITVSIPPHTLALLDDLLTAEDRHYADPGISARDDSIAQSCRTLIDETLGMYLPDDYALALDEEARQLVGGPTPPFTHALNNMNEAGTWNEVDALIERPACLTLASVIREARDLRTDGPPENPEYDRALVELTMSLSRDYPDDPDGRRAYIERAVLGR